MTTTPTAPTELDSAADVLAFARECRATADRAEAGLFTAAATWAEQHPPESIHDTAVWARSAFGDTALALAGPGAPRVSEFCLAEFAAAVGMSTDSGRSLVADAVETKHRLPRLWSRVMAGAVPTWRVRRIAQVTLGLSLEAAAFVDSQVAAFAHRCGPATTDRLVAEAVARFMPAKAREDAARAADGRHVTFHHGHVSFGGTTYLEAELDLADALDLDAALSRGAETLRIAGCEEALDARRAMAAGDLARRQLSLDLDGGPVARPGGPTATAAEPRQVVLHVHLSDAAIAGTSGAGLDLARVEEHRRVVTADQVRSWCANPDTAVTVRPVLDLAEQIRVDAYEVPDRLAEQVQLRDGGCAFPWCTLPSRSCDVDHVVPHSRGGPTASDNLAPLCRRHHRLKTHSPWRYTVLDPGTYLWSSPHGYRFLRDHSGTLDVTRQ